MARFVPTQGLDALIAARIGRPAVTRLAAKLADAARRAAPDAKLWVTAGDERVRTSHVATDGQLVPDNLRFILPKAGHHDYGAGRDLARRPGDPNLPIANSVNCRCADVTMPGAIAATIHTTETVVLGTRVRAEVQTHFPRAAESEFPPLGDSGGGWLRGAAAEVARANRARSRPSP